MSITDGQGSKFFRDQNVFEQDLNNIEYTKTKLVRDSVKYTTSIPGVCALNKNDTSLKVTATATDITVQPGAAIDALGRLIVVPPNTAASGSVSTDPYYHPEWPTNVITHGDEFPGPENGNFYVYISYVTQESLAEVDDDGASHNTRVYDSYEITIIRKLTGTPPTNGILLAEYEVSSGDIQNADIIDLRTLYSAATPSAVTVETHSDALHVNGIGDVNFIDYTDPTLNAESDDYYVGSLGFKIFNNLGGDPIHSRITIRSSIDTYVNLDGNYLTGELTTSKVEWDNTDDTSGWYVVYLDTNKVVYRSDRADSVSGPFNLPTGSFPICKVYWNALISPRDLSLVEDLRVWGTTKGEILGNQFTSGSLTLNKNGASIGNDSRDLTTAQLNFIKEANHLKFEDSQFEFSADVKTAGNLYINSRGPDGNSTLYFYQNGSPTGAYLRFNDSQPWFELSGTLITGGDLWTSGNLLTNRNVYVNYDGPNSDAYVYFYNGNATGRYLKWNNTSSPKRFEFNDTIYSSSNLRAAGNIYVDADGAEPNSYLYFHGTTANLNWDNVNAQFEFSHKINVSISGSQLNDTVISGLDLANNKITNVADPTSDQDAATKKWVEDNLPTFTETDTLDSVCDRGNVTNRDIKARNFYVNYGGVSGDSYLFFHNTDGYLKWDDSDDRFVFSKPPRVYWSSGKEQDLHLNTLFSEGAEHGLGVTNSGYLMMFVYGFIYSGAKVIRIWIRQHKSAQVGFNSNYKLRIQLLRGFEINPPTLATGYITVSRTEYHEWDMLEFNPNSFGLTRGEEAQFTFAIISTSSTNAVAYIQGINAYEYSY